MYVYLCRSRWRASGKVHIKYQNEEKIWYLRLGLLIFWSELTESLQLLTQSLFTIMVRRKTSQNGKISKTLQQHKTTSGSTPVRIWGYARGEHYLKLFTSICMSLRTVLLPPDWLTSYLIAVCERQVRWFTRNRAKEVMKPSLVSSHVPPYSSSSTCWKLLK